VVTSDAAGAAGGPLSSVSKGETMAKKQVRTYEVVVSAVEEFGGGRQGWAPGAILTDADFHNPGTAEEWIKTGKLVVKKTFYVDDESSSAKKEDGEIGGGPKPPLPNEDGSGHKIGRGGSDE
jgi:hypothetical protein